MAAPWLLYVLSFPLGLLLMIPLLDHDMAIYRDKEVRSLSILGLTVLFNVVRAGNLLALLVPLICLVRQFVLYTIWVQRPDESAKSV